MSFEVRVRPARTAMIAAWTAALLSAAGCSQAAPRKARAPQASAPAASAPSGASAAAPATASAPVVRRGLDPQRAKGKVLLQLSLPASLDLGGFGFTATYDPDKFHVAEPVNTPALANYMCAVNLTQPGSIRYNCAGQVNEPRGGVLATFEVSYAQVPPTAADFTVTQSEVIDKMAVKLEGARVEVAIAPVPKP